ncbi:MAG: two-component system, chemotaxis family, CheB/CheR fusion protein [Acidobacteriota bacterium]|jgi:two-component system CheB/CheR fusion protein|nr:two-component system, chemotaxis family, CheB/CheR fusion protein [Acidobacteriota bacterium]
MDAEPTPTAESSTSEFTRLLEYLKASRGFDFGAYKVSTLMRRVQKRMREVGVQSYAQYADYLEVQPNEFGPLFDTVLINVTSFFRDPDAWQFLSEHILPRIVREKAPDAPIRIWSAGCATGEEAYTLAMLLTEAVGEEDFRKRVKIYATDADEEALLVARQGTYDERGIASIPPDLLQKYFDVSASRKVFRNELRRCLIFGRHDLIQDAAISRLDLLVCRNTLMYFNTEAQDRILARFHFAVNRTGYLFLGKAETLLSHNSNFKPVELKHRVFSRTSTNNLRDRLLALAPTPADSESGARHLRLRESALDASPVAQVVVDRRGYLVLASGMARKLFNLGLNDVGRLLQDLEISYRPVELRSHLEGIYETRAPVVVKDVEWRGPGADAEVRLFEVQVAPLIDVKETILGACISFVDQTQARQLRVELERSNQELETAYEELQSGNEELETTNEELQSTVEELETTNEELQSANEELETMNEELQSTNDELRNLNDRLQLRTEELNQFNGYFQTVLNTLRAAVVVMDRALHVRVWSEKAQDFWGVRGDEVQGQSFLNLDIGLPVEELRLALREALADGREREQSLDGVNRRGKQVRCRVRIAPYCAAAGVDGLILLIEEAEPG